MQTYHRFSVVFSRRTDFFKTLNNPSFSFVALSAMDFSKGQPVRTLDCIQKGLSGNVAEHCIAGK